MEIAVFYHHIRQAALQTGYSELEILQRIRGYGITQLEFDIRELDDKKQIKELLGKSDFQVSSIYEFFDLGQRNCEEHGEQLLQAASEFKAGKIMIIPGFYHSIFCCGRAAEEKRMVRKMREICKAADQKGIIPMIEDFDDQKSPIATSKKMLQFANSIPELKIAFDTGNFVYSAESEEKAYHLLKEKIVHVHCKDRALQQRGKTPGKKAVDGRMIYPSAVGSGCISMEYILKELKRDGYNGILTIEHFDTDDYLKDMISSAQWLKQTWEDI